MFDPNNYILAGVSLLAVTFGLVQFMKEMLEWSGKKVVLLSACTGFFLMGLFQLSEVLPEPYGTIFKMAFLSIAFGLSASGYYDYLKPRLPDQS